MVIPYVGILVNNALYTSIPLNQHQTYEAIPLYLQAGKELGIAPCFFRIQDVRMDTLTVHAYVQKEQGFIQEWIPLPSVIHNRAIYLDNKSYLKLEAWNEYGINLFNRWNRYGKLYIHNQLMKDESLLPYLPETLPATQENLSKMMKNHNSLIIKPNKSSIGRGVMKMDRIRDGWRLVYPKNLKLKNRVWNRLFFRKVIPRILLNNIKKVPYIIQQRLPLAAYDERPFDLRVSVQRGADGNWGVTGIVAKVASRKLFLTNAAQGGQVRQLPEVLLQYPELNASAVQEAIHAFALRVVQQLSVNLPHLADVGLDIGIDKDGKPLFIECNGKDQRYTFLKANMQEVWEATYKKPMAYAKYLIDGGQPR
ncbi:YheC/YheD family endospore coat-associated protein [Paenibacillus eucommiae]|uniref:YheC/YheD family protein n=1 Tax=Paenibacillus eucommiae TaxID=1355755 RepID=A0ABS4J238_9BACL|nr:YheC/YheD family protein [Paenibacillus eucommiae]MBP1993316.1 hypothetical protein [Paenibacillus eucommiae]